MRAIAAFTPIPIAPNAELTDQGIRLIGTGPVPGKKIDIWNRADVQTVLPMLTARIATAVAGLLPRVTDGMEAWDIVNDRLFRFVHGGDDTLIEEAAPYLATCRVLMNAGPTNDDERVLAVFVDRLLPFARGERIEALMPYRAPTLQDVYQDLNGGSREQDLVKGLRLPWPGTLGADIAPFRSVGDALDFFGYGDLVVVGDRIEIPLGSQTRTTVEIRFDEDGLRDLKGLLSAARSAMGMPETAGESLVRKTESHGHCAVASGFDRFRVRSDQIRDGSACWTFRRLYIPKAKIENYGFEFA
ncbi:hypothetical protein HFO56_34040 [Rhizobium laguerreae]|uniref:hypothetical protein n=1 Tax=Rhizobium laguerreae TaxID=1076926 RepID=UPI001C91C5A1|nr:hypothetical protein [Rhizobium laguerreae]MBY3157348.1 hypothetical protein [Rhizobium laguerreae]